ncbi:MULTISPECIES: carbohydrate ABC transporter permease [Kosmotoga]|uniref:Binding-protein-dependent transport systems inner membrane component n=1 Tax=Kosmotoga olearia (strain ATCC BAA-1733 / DSM 21960 / TBF 19.5.1) TaxID=521045 RepID=C5CH70_KOSOT|nr:MULTISPECIES: sugar ABC transporter permease [Kosmotoga]ACR80673.1 binding-protein-dependent transport systems inner membrane component [Kosmotoga olearia TBF 19.5.1]MDI3495360.1 multiple sugar transport system permease protein [Pseudothermotoga sp.]OAA19122.1 ABC transporter permease [Kosmotoga sp. DU53]
MKKRQLYGYLFILPAMSLFVVFLFIPVVMALVMAFQEVGVWGSEWVGFENFKEIIHWEDFWVALRNTALYTSIVVFKNISVALVIASLLLSLKNKWQSFFRAAYYLPTVTSAVVISLIWGWLLNASFGPINMFLQKLGLQPVPWLVDPDIAMWSIILTDMVIAPGSGIILFLAAMNNIPKTYYEAADIDGANWFVKWWRITVPLVKPTMLYLTISYTIVAMSVFDKIYILTHGGPGNATITFVYLIYNTAFRDFNYGLASALSVIFFGIAVVISFFQFRMMSQSYEF